MTRRFAAALPALAVTLALALALASRPSPTRAAAYDIDIVDGAFQPAELTVYVGEPVTWTNKGTVVHTVTSDDGELDSGDNAPGEAYGHVFETPGVYTYHCVHHPEMQGTITVLPAPATPPGGSPEVTPPPGTLPPNFSPFPTTGPMPTPMAAPTAVPTPAASSTPGSGSGGDSSGLALVAGTLAVVVLAGAIIFLARRRSAP